LIIVDPASGAIRKSVTRYVEVQDLAYAPDGGRLAVGVCHGDRIVELETADYAETAVLMTPDGGCAWDFAYSPDGESLAATLPTRRGDPLGARFADLRVVGDDPTVETELGRSLPALAYRPDGAALVVAGSGGLHVLAVAEGYRKIRTVDQVDVRELAFTVDGSFLLVGLDSGLVVLDATRGYVKYHEDQLGEVRDLAVDASGKWIAVVRPTQVTVHRAPDLGEIARFTGQGLTSADFSIGGARLAVADSMAQQVRIFERALLRAPAVDPPVPRRAADRGGDGVGITSWSCSSPFGSCWASGGPSPGPVLPRDAVLLLQYFPLGLRLLGRRRLGLRRRPSFKQSRSLSGRLCPGCGNRRDDIVPCQITSRAQSARYDFTRRATG
jgi:WD40 repeat protein